MALMSETFDYPGFNAWMAWVGAIDQYLIDTQQAIGYSLFKFFYNIYLHPLRNYPGPFLARGTHFANFFWVYKGNLHTKVKQFNAQYGDVVRIAPDMLVYTSAQAWKDICGHRKAGSGSFLKDGVWYSSVGKTQPSILSANDADHSRGRRLLAHAFSEKALREQEGLLQSYVDLLVNRVREYAVEGSPADMTRWYNYTTFDIIGDLAFGEPFGCLETRTYHPWVKVVFQAIKAMTLIRPFITLFSASVLNMVVPKKLEKARDASFEFSKEKVHRRLALQTTRPDFMTYILKHNDEKGMSIEEIEANANILIVAGSETTASLLSGCTFFLLTHPKVYQKFVDEIRGAFQHEADITVQSVSKLPYVLAVLDESLRMYPPTPNVLPRSVPQGGAIIDGKFVPEGTSVSMAYYATFRSESNFAKPDCFIPERWLGNDPQFATDKKEALQPFSFGPRNCLGKNLAYAEMRLIMAKLAWNFDMTLQRDSYDWDQQITYNVWEKKPLMVRFTPVKR
ncbi:hypothetical protein AJ79_07908 [Helicocarpus griseus UAMH5409]|uniref:Cytochrome P450 monooxygenase n=1 Tax=Helicocarpus griseus UAMH5409 TaxID=1447875 RepID=A0A2B7WXZ9_9EURO|nr:hypothetical protein AJ79_07908 [Helicocarpus griseus UAMH5409]